MLSQIRPAVVMIVLFTALTGLVYPLAITEIAQTVFRASANGDLIEAHGVVIGSRLIGQAFASDRYFHGRPSATSAPDPKDPSKTIDAPYNAANSSGSNLGPTSRSLADRVKAAVQALRPANGGPVPADAVTTSASGLDPDISPAFARLQVARVAAARKLAQDRVEGLVSSHIQYPFLGVIGEPRVNVLLLNLDLDRLSSS